MRRFVLVAAAVAGFVVGYSAIARAFPGGGVLGRGEFHGYFTNAYDTSGTFVFQNIYNGEAFPSSINNTGAFTGFIKGKLATSNQQNITGASFIIDTMLGKGAPGPRKPSAADIAAWEALVNAYGAAGRITWRQNISYNINSYYQGASGGGSPNDDAFYDNSNTQPAIVFHNPDGSFYAIKWECANPVGNNNLHPLQTLSTNFNMSGRVTVFSNPAPHPGETVGFQYFLKDNGPQSTGATHIWAIKVDGNTGAAINGSIDDGTFNAGQEKTAFLEYYVVPPGTPAGTQICRQLGYDPTNGSGGRNGKSAKTCVTVQADYNLAPSITITEGGAPLPSGSFIEPGDTVTFTYSVNNNTAGDASGIACNMYVKNHPGYFAIPTPAESGGSAPVGPTCQSTFPHNTTTNLGSETVASVPADTSLCRSLYVNPADPGGGPVGVEACAYVASKPYMRVYGGDVSAGNPACGTITPTDAAIVGWNKEGAGAFAGAGARYAAMAVNDIYDFSSALGNTGGAATPDGLAFANTAAVTGGLFGGSFGSPSCIYDYYDNMPGTTTALSSGNLSSLGTGTYTATGPITLGGNINPNQRTAIYVDGDVLITGNITFTGSWNTNSLPFFELIARGNIYISSSVTQIDGLYVAQSNGGSGGVIATCADTTLPAVSYVNRLSGGVFNTPCNNQLTVNGAFVAEQVQLLRTHGTLRNSSAGEASTSGNQAEVFNYSPALWMAMPPSQSTDDTYESITSLPPIL
ncbi:MAG TPA: hypothetical protein VJP80_08165 [Candidatus Saccharimonadales bacterium]|nr:hypothetical protein [Candidatus Saccharimonadales bacterium]